MPSYLRQWFIHRHSGTDPVRLRNGSIESKLIVNAVVKPPESSFPHLKQPDEVAVCIPYSKHHDPRIYNHLTDTGKRALLGIIKNAFDVIAGATSTTSAKSASNRRILSAFTWSNAASRRTAPVGTPSRKFTNASARTTSPTSADRKITRQNPAEKASRKIQKQKNNSVERPKKA